MAEDGCFIVEFEYRSDNGDTHVGPFKSRDDANVWVVAQDFDDATWIVLPVAPVATS